MDRLIGFNEYDVLAYLMAGLTALALWDVIVRTNLLFRREWTFGTGTMLAIAAYIAGHIVAIPSQLVFEEWLVRENLGRPTDFLAGSVGPQEKWKWCARNFPKEVAKTDAPAQMQKEPAQMQKDEAKTGTQACMNEEAATPRQQGVWVRTVFSYCQQLSQGLEKKIRDKAPCLSGEALFTEAYAVARKDTAAAERMMAFQRLYLLFRNMAFVLLLGAVLAAATGLVRSVCGHRVRAEPANPAEFAIHYGPRWLTDWRLQVLLCGLIGIILLHRHLFFYRLFSIEVLRSYAEAPPPTPIFQ